MTLATDIADDMDDFDGLESVTYTSVTSTGNTTFTSDVALPRAVTQADLSSVDELRTGVAGRVWHMKANEFTTAGIVPKRHDKITDGDGVDWIIKSLDLQTLETRWRFVTIQGR